MVRSLGIRVFAPLIISLVVFSSGCGSGSKTRLRFANMSPDESSLSLLVDGNTVSTESFESASGYQSVSSGSRHLQVEPPGSSTPVIDETLTINSGTDTTFFALNFSSNIEPLVLTDDNSAPASGDFKIRVVNASPGLGSADVYVVASGTNIGSVNPTVSALGFGSASTYFSLAAGSYDVMFTAPGQKLAAIDTGTLSLSAGQIRTVVGLNTFAGFTTTVLDDLN